MNIFLLFSYQIILQLSKIKMMQLSKIKNSQQGFGVRLVGGLCVLNFK